MIKQYTSYIEYDTNTHKKIIKYIRDNIITDPEEYLESYDEINRVAAKPEHIKLYRFIQQLQDDEENPEIIEEDINELKTVLKDNIIRELEFYDILSNNGQL